MDHDGGKSRFFFVFFVFLAYSIRRDKPRLKYYEYIPFLGSTPSAFGPIPAYSIHGSISLGLGSLTSAFS